MTFYAGLSSTASRLLTQFGQAMTLQRSSSGGYNPATGSVTSTVTSYTFNGAQVPITRIDDGAFDPQTVVEGRAAIVLGENVAVEPKPGDEVVFGGYTWQVIGSTSVNPAGTNVLNRMRVKR